MRRVTRLGEQAEEILTLAAVAGQAFRAALLERAAEAPRDAVVDVLDRAVAAGLLATTDDPDRLTFSHALIRETLYARLSDARRVRLHRRVAETLEAHRAELRPDVAELAHHFFQARHVGGVEPAIRYAREAADRAAESLAWEDEALQLERALDAERLREPSDAADRTELLLALGDGAHPRRPRAPRGPCSRRPRRSSRGPLARAARTGGDRLRRPLLRGGRHRPQADRAAARGARRVRPEEASCASRAARPARRDPALRRRPRGVAAALRARRSRSPTRLGDDETLAAALAGRHVSLLHIAHLDERLVVSGRLLRAGRRGRRPASARCRRCSHGSSTCSTLGDLARRPAGSRAAGRAGARAAPAAVRALRRRLALHVRPARRPARGGGAARLRVVRAAPALETQDAESVLAAQLFMIRRAQGRLAELLPAVRGGDRAVPGARAPGARRCRSPTSRRATSSRPGASSTGPSPGSTRSRATSSGWRR